jgi:CyaY protein
MAVQESQGLSESRFRALAQEAYARIGRAFDEVDPDLAEAEESLGSLTISLPNGAKWILSMQPPVRQLWLAVASLGRAYHFNYAAESGTWHDDKGEGIELMTHLESLLRDVAGVEISLKA